ncbi:hypothetical protein DNTS_034158 [Danionella cerebrum]|uniref:Fibronectin type-III domain-containing protein n=1 Tax=Danionella cerebrum TaxID=2873325 RepID=A0A553QPR3_9TELE|nr:hypothetical protein DNTS_034158 [Danionella translucida]
MCLGNPSRSACVTIVSLMNKDNNTSKPTEGAPSQVSEVIKQRVLQHSVQLSWQEPEQPNGVITEYEIKYYEKSLQPSIIKPSFRVSGFRLICQLVRHEQECPA